MMMFFRQLFCKHDFRKTGNRHYTKHRGFIIVQGVYRCAKCGKEVTR